MKVIADNLDFAEKLLGKDRQWIFERDSRHAGEIRILADRLFSGNSFYSLETIGSSHWKYLLLVENAPESQYDVLIRMARQGDSLPDGILCLAGTGVGFHGFKDRPWTSRTGNIHLSVFLAPNRPIPHFGAVFMALPAVSALEVVDAVLPRRTNRVGIKWVNDILVDGKKICGVLAHSQSMGEKVSTVVLGIGMNVETAPAVSSDRFVPHTVSLSDLGVDSSKCNLAYAFNRMKDRLAANYDVVKNGEGLKLLDDYRKRSAVIGKRIRICDDSGGVKSLSGRVAGIGDNLELFLEEQDAPVTRGRLSFLPTDDTGSPVSP